MGERIIITVELLDDEAIAFHRFLKMCGFDDYAPYANAEMQQCEMRDCGVKIKAAIEDAVSQVRPTEPPKPRLYDQPGDGPPEPVNGPGTPPLAWRRRSQDPRI